MSYGSAVLGATTSYSTGRSPGGAFLIIVLAIVVFYVAAFWRVFAKAGEPGWGALIPIYNVYLYCRVAGRPEWWVILFFIPLVNVVIALILAQDIARAFGKSAGFGIGLWILSFIFVPILAFGPSEFSGHALSGTRT